MSERSMSRTAQYMEKRITHGFVPIAVKKRLDSDKQLVELILSVAGKDSQERLESLVHGIVETVSTAHRIHAQGKLSREQLRHILRRLHLVGKKVEHAARICDELELIDQKHLPDFTPNQEYLDLVDRARSTDLFYPSGIKVSNVRVTSLAPLQSLNPLWALSVLSGDLSDSALMQLNALENQSQVPTEKTRGDLELIAKEIYLLWKHGAEPCPAFPGGKNSAPVNLYFHMCHLAGIEETDAGDAIYHLRDIKVYLEQL